MALTFVVDLNSLLLALHILGICLSCKLSDDSCSFWVDLSGDLVGTTCCRLCLQASLFFLPRLHEVYWLKTRMVLIVICQYPTVDGIVKLESCHYSYQVPFEPEGEGG